MSQETKNRTPKKREPEPHKSEEEIREENFDKTLEDSFPASDPPSSIPDPDDEEEHDAA